ncbi:MAG: ATP-dependent Clp protease adaptor ClpS, partial [Flavisolibacter sp.]|nr:ATP-dependent Clp protease adaptor ClpS [Flavisolibacter sp.]
MAHQFDTYEQLITEKDTDLAFPYQLIVWNDDVNTFDWVIETLVEICRHTYEQAEQ